MDNEVSKSDEKVLEASKENNEKASKENNEKASTESTEKQKNKEDSNTSSNVEKQSPPSESKNDENAYLEHIVYDAEGVAFYIDPNTKCKYKWSSETNTWVADESSAKQSESIYENEFYKWCPEKNEWIPKSTSSESNTKQTQSSESSTNKSENSIANDPRNVTYSSEDGTYTYTDTDGTIFFWDTEKSAWFPKIDDDFIALYQLNYGSNENTSAQIGNPQTINENIEDKIDESSNVTANITSGSANTFKKKLSAVPPKWFDIPSEQNTKVYVDNLPLDITEAEFVEVMSKCGMIMRDPNTRKYKVKLYTEPNGQPKGDGLCDYIKVESVELALSLLDGYDVRGKKISVQRAKFQMRGDYNPALKPKIKKKEKEKIQKMKERLFDWRPEKMLGQRSKHERNVIIKNLFTPVVFDKDVQLIIDYQNDLKEECAKCGTVRKVVLYDQHPEGVAQITMSSPEEADVVVQMMNGRYFGKRQLTAEIWDGKNKYKVASKETETAQRSATWEKFLGDEEMKEPVSVDTKVAVEQNSTCEQRSES